MSKVEPLQELSPNMGGNATTNNNFNKIEEALQNTLSRDGSTPNEMEADLDLNGNDLLNVGEVNALEVTVNGSPVSESVVRAEVAAAGAEASAEEAAQHAVLKLQSLALLESFDGGTNGDIVTVLNGFNGEPEHFKYDISSTLTVNGATVVDAVGMGAGQWISTRTTYADFSEMSSNIVSRGDGVTHSTLDESFSYIEDSDSLLTIGGVGLTPVEKRGKVDLAQFGVSEGASDNKQAIDTALQMGFKRLTISEENCRTSGGHILDGVVIDGVDKTATRFLHVDGDFISGTYVQSGGNDVVITSASHGVVVGQSVYVTVSSGSLSTGLYTVHSITEDSFTVETDTLATTSGAVSADPSFACFKVHRPTFSGQSAGTGIKNMRIGSSRSRVHGATTVIQSYGHAKLHGVEIADAAGDGSFGTLIENYNGKWSESWRLTDMRWSNCKHSLAFRNSSTRAGTLSAAYGKVQGIVSNSPTGSTALEIDGVDPYSSSWDLVIYQDDDAAFTAVNVIGGGKLNKSSGYIRGEAAGSSTPNHTFFRVDSTSQFRDNQGLDLFSGNGLISIASGATVVNNRSVVSSLSPQVRLTFDNKVSFGARLGSNTSIASGSWVSLTDWTEDGERPSGSNNFSSGVFTAPMRGLYRVSFSSAFTPRSTGVSLGVRVKTTDRDFVLAKTVTPQFYSYTDGVDSALQDSDQQLEDVVLSGGHTVWLDEGETIRPQVYSSLADTVRASDADGSATLFSVEYVSS